MAEQHGWRFAVDGTEVDRATPGVSFEVVYWTVPVDGHGWANVKFIPDPAGPTIQTASGNSVETIACPVAPGDCYAWQSTVSGHVPGVLTIRFYENCDGNCDLISSCSIMVE